MQANITYPYIFGTSVPGPSHIRNAIPCQDSFAHETISNFGIIAVSDGLGSAKNSDIGAEIAVRSTIRRAKEILEKKILEFDDKKIFDDIISFVRAELEFKANELQCSLNELACTIIIVIIHNDNISVAHIGDGSVVARKNKNLILISGPGESEYINEVTPLTIIEWKTSLRFYKDSEIDSIAVFTDGCQEAIIQKNEKDLIPYDGFFNPLFSYAHKIFNNIKMGEKDIKDFLESQRMNEISEDDKTLVVAILGNDND